MVRAVADGSLRRPEVPAANASAGGWRHCRVCAPHMVCLKTSFWIIALGLFLNSKFSSRENQ